MKIIYKNNEDILLNGVYERGRSIRFNNRIIIKVTLVLLKNWSTYNMFERWSRVAEWEKADFFKDVWKAEEYEKKLFFRWILGLIVGESTNWSKICRKWEGCDGCRDFVVESLNPKIHVSRSIRWRGKGEGVNDNL